MPMPRTASSSLLSNERPRRPRGLGHYVALGAVVIAACSSTTTATDTTLRTTAMLVDPVDFLGEHPCAQLPGTVNSYQATLIDVSPDLDEPFALASTDVIDCNVTAYFGYVTPGRRYMTHIEAFDVTGLRVQTPGVRVVVDDSGKVIQPRYRTSCKGLDDGNYGGAGGQGGDGGAAAERDPIGVACLVNTQVYVRGCAPLVDSGSLGPTGISISIESALVDLSCGAEAGQIDHFVVQTGEGAPVDPAAGGAGGQGGAAAGGTGAGGTGPVISGPSADCTGTVTIDGLTPASNVSYRVALYEKGQAAPSYETTCRAFTTAGVITPATCNPVHSSNP